MPDAAAQGRRGGTGCRGADPGQITRPRSRDRVRERPGRSARSGLLLWATLVNLGGRVDLEILIGITEAITPLPASAPPSRADYCPADGVLCQLELKPPDLN